MSGSALAGGWALHWGNNPDASLAKPHPAPREAGHAVQDKEGETPLLMSFPAAISAWVCKEFVVDVVHHASLCNLRKYTFSDLLQKR